MHVFVVVVSLVVLCLSSECAAKGFWKKVVDFPEKVVKETVQVVKHVGKAVEHAVKAPLKIIEGTVDAAADVVRGKFDRAGRRLVEGACDGISESLSVFREVVEGAQHMVPNDVKKALDFIGLSCVGIVTTVPLGMGGNKCGPAGRNIPDTFVEFLVPDDIVTPTTTLHFGSACATHDSCYDRCGANKSACDNEFRNNLLEECRRHMPGASFECCKGLVNLYVGAVEGQGGRAAFNAAQRDHC